MIIKSVLIEDENLFRFVIVSSFPFMVLSSKESWNFFYKAFIDNIQKQEPIFIAHIKSPSSWTWKNSILKIVLINILIMKLKHAAVEK